MCLFNVKYESRWDFSTPISWHTGFPAFALQIYSPLFGFFVRHYSQRPIPLTLSWEVSLIFYVKRFRCSITFFPIRFTQGSLKASFGSFKSVLFGSSLFQHFYFNCSFCGFVRECTECRKEKLENSCTIRYS